MNCVVCNGKSKVIDSRLHKQNKQKQGEHSYLRRRRECLSCETKWSTLETVIIDSIMVTAKAAKEKGFGIYTKLEPKRKAD